MQISAVRANQGILSEELLPKNRKTWITSIRGIGMVDRQHLFAIRQISYSTPTTGNYSDR